MRWMENLFSCYVARVRFGVDVNEWGWGGGGWCWTSKCLCGEVVASLRRLHSRNYYTSPDGPCIKPYLENRIQWSSKVCLPFGVWIPNGSFYPQANCYIRRNKNSHQAGNENRALSLDYWECWYLGISVIHMLLIYTVKYKTHQIQTLKWFVVGVVTTADSPTTTTVLWPTDVRLMLEVWR